MDPLGEDLWEQSRVHVLLEFCVHQSPAPAASGGREQSHPTEENVKPHGLWGELGLQLHHRDILGQQSGQNCIICLRNLPTLAACDTKMFLGSGALPARVLSHPGVVLGAAFLRQAPKVKDVLF